MVIAPCMYDDLYCLYSPSHAPPLRMLDRSGQHPWRWHAYPSRLRRAMESSPRRPASGITFGRTIATGPSLRGLASWMLLTAWGTPVWARAGFRQTNHASFSRKPARLCLSPRPNAIASRRCPLRSRNHRFTSGARFANCRSHLHRHRKARVTPYHHHIRGNTDTCPDNSRE